MKRYFLGLLIVLASLPALAQPFSTFANDPLKIKQFTLANGLVVYLHEDHNKPEVFGAMVVRAGGKYDPKDATGMGHYLEHMLFKGTTRMGTTNYEAERIFLAKIDSLYEELPKQKDPAARLEVQKQINAANLKASEFAIANEMDQMLQSIGSRDLNAYTDQERIVYHDYFPPHQLEKWMAIYSHRFDKPIFRLFQSELETVYEERNRATDNMGYTLMTTVSKNFFKNHPYGTQEILGTAEHLKNPSLVKMKQYYDKYYVANNMALVLCGDIDVAQASALATKYFSSLPRGPVDAFPKYEEQPFNGREYVKINATPIKVGVMAWRTAPKGHPDEPAMEILSYLLNNDNETGLLDKLHTQGQINTAQVIPYVHNDLGGTGVLFVPKIIGQSMETAEELVKQQLARLREGKFSDTAFITAKNNIRLARLKAYEDNEAKANLIAEAFAAGLNWQDFIQYEGRLTSLTKDDVVRVANKYLGPNYLMVASFMGSPAKEKLDKPPFEPVANKTDGQRSEFAKEWDQIKTPEPKAAFVDFQRDFQLVEPYKETRIFTVNNPLNNLFELTLKFQAGTNHHPRYAQSASYLNYLGSQQHSADQLKAIMGMLGCSYSITAGPNETIVQLEGFEENLEKALPLLAGLLRSPRGDASKIKILAEGAESDRKFERKEPAQIAQGLYYYVIYGNNASVKRRLPISAIKKLSSDTLLADLRRIFDSQVTVHYAGKMGGQELRRKLEAQGLLAEPKRVTAEIDFPVTNPEKPQVIFLNRKDARQSQVYFYVKGKPYTKTDDPQLAAFSEYYGGMNGIVFQEVREFRSLAYTAFAQVVRRRRPGLDNYLHGFVGCQGDKTNDAVDIMNQLLTTMPQKPERTDGIRNSLVQKAMTSKPDFRSLTETVEGWMERGYLEDPAKVGLPVWQQLSFEDINNYFNQNVKGRPQVIVIVGNKKQIDMKKLAAYGPIKEVKEKDFFTE